MKKLLSLILILALAMSLLAGCGSDSSKLSESQLYEQEFDTSKYDSHITFSVDGKEYETEFMNMGGSYNVGESIKVFYDPAVEIHANFIALFDLTGGFRTLHDRQSDIDRITEKDP